MRALVIANPTAGRQGKHSLELVIGCLSKCWTDLEVYLTTGPSDATRAASKAAADGYEVVVAVGGDGSINEVANGLVGSKVKMGIIPLGTENVLARELGISLDPVRACHHLLNATPHSVDMGRIGERYFLCFAGIGFDAFVAHNLSRSLKASWGAMAYFITSLRLIGAYSSTPRTAIIKFDEQEIRAGYWMMLCGNIRGYGGGLKPTPSAQINDGLLDLCIYPRAKYPEMARQMILTRTGSHIDLAGVIYLQAKRFEIQTVPGELVQLDGDSSQLGTPLAIDVEPSSLELLY